VREYPGDFSAYLEYREREEAEEAARGREIAGGIELKVVVRTDDDAPRKLSFKEKREFEMLEAQIEKAEIRKTEIESQLNVNATDAGKVHALFTEQQQLLEQLDRDMERWAELAERSEM
jgi:ATP-binding cassette subfamily F protein uup